MKKKDIISIIQDNDISEYYSLKNLCIETSAKPHIDSEIINITHGLSIVAFECKKTFAEVSNHWTILHQEMYI